MEIEDTGLDIEMLSDEGGVNRNSDPVDADFDVICTDDDDDDVSTNDCNELPPSLLCAFKKDAAEAARAAAANRKFEGSSTVAESFSVSPPTPSTTAMPIAYQVVSAAQQTSTAAQQTSTAAYKVVSDTQNAIPTSRQTVSAAYQTSAAAQHSVLTSLNTVAFSTRPVFHPPIPSADSAAIVPQASEASTAALIQSCLQPARMPAALQQKDLLPKVTGGAMKELILNNSIPLDDEWSAVETELILPGKETQSQISTGQEGVVVKAEPVITFQEAFEYFQSYDMSDIKDRIQPSIERRGLSAWTHYLFGPPKLHPTLLPSKEMTFCMAATTFDNGNYVHVHSLLGVYRNLTGSPQDCRRFGSHWETIGFQGNDPSTDLRGVGVFGLLQLLYLTSQPQLVTLKKQIYNLSLHKTQNFPFCVMGLNLSKLVLQMLREDKLNRLCNKRGDLMSVVNDAFAACYYKVYHVWKNQKKTIVDSGFVLRDVESQLRKSTPGLIKELEEYLKNGSASIPKWKMSKCSDDKLDSFVGIADILNK